MTWLMFTKILSLIVLILCAQGIAYGLVRKMAITMGVFTTTAIAATYFIWSMGWLG